MIRDYHNYNSMTIIPNTFGLAATADRYCVVDNLDDLEKLIAQGVFASAPFFVVGAGSNVVFTRHYEGVVLHLANRGVRRLVGVGESGASSDTVFVEAAAGESWDSFVRFCVDQGWYGLENLVSIPGTVGAAPVQNVGAYGLEAKDRILEVRTINLLTGEHRVFSNDECRFAYRDSVFKHFGADASSPFVVTSVLFRLSATFTPNLTYRPLAEHFSGLENVSAQAVLDFIDQLRWSKLPRPETTGSAGSFFKNPVVDAPCYESLRQSFPGLVAFPVGDDYKLSAGWLIEQAGWKGKDLGRCGVYEKQALVLVNRGGATGDEVLCLADAVAADVWAKFGIRLEKEAIIL